MIILRSEGSYSQFVKISHTYMYLFFIHRTAWITLIHGITHIWIISKHQIFWAIISLKSLWKKGGSKGPSQNPPSFFSPLSPFLGWGGYIPFTPFSTFTTVISSPVPFMKSMTTSTISKKLIYICSVRSVVRPKIIRAKRFNLPQATKTCLFFEPVSRSFEEVTIRRKKIPVSHSTRLKQRSGATRFFCHPVCLAITEWRLFEKKKKSQSINN